MSPAHSMYGGQVPGYPQPGFVPQYYQGGPVPQGYPQAQHFMPRQEKVLNNSVFESLNKNNKRTELCRNSVDSIKFTKNIDITEIKSLLFKIQILFET